MLKIIRDALIVILLGIIAYFTFASYHRTVVADRRVAAIADFRKECAREYTEDKHIELCVQSRMKTAEAIKGLPK